MKNNNFRKINHSLRAGFILPFTMLIATIILFVTASSMTLLSKQLYFSKIYRQSQAAYFAADDAVACAVTIDDTYLAGDGLGIFPSDADPAFDSSQYIDDVLVYVSADRVVRGLLPTTITRSDVVCAKSRIFDAGGTTLFAVSPVNYQYHSAIHGIEEGKTSTFNMKMDIGGGVFRCARVTVNKTHSYRQIIAQGYAECDNPTGSVERAVVNTVIVE